MQSNNDFNRFNEIRDSPQVTSNTSTEVNKINSTAPTFQHKTNKQLFEINEILSKCKSTFSQLPKMEAIKIFPEDRPAEVKIEEGPPKIKLPKITLSRMNVDDAELMQKSLKEFAENKPDLARKLGVIKDESDMFSQMKANGNFGRKKDKNTGLT